MPHYMDTGQNKLVIKAYLQDVTVKYSPTQANGNFYFIGMDSKWQHETKQDRMIREFQTVTVNREGQREVRSDRNPVGG